MDSLKDVVNSLEIELNRSKAMEEELKNLYFYIERLDEAMASEARILMDTKMVGSFVSNLNLTETAEEIISRAIKYIYKMKNYDK